MSLVSQLFQYGLLAVALIATLALIIVSLRFLFSERAFSSSTTALTLASVGVIAGVILATLLIGSLYISQGDAFIVRILEPVTYLRTTPVQ
jgi:uncharacterized membrane protein